MRVKNMTDNSFIKPADRIASFKPYYFASLAKKIAVLQENGVDIIKIDMGSPVSSSNLLQNSRLLSLPAGNLAQT